MTQDRRGSRSTEADIAPARENATTDFAAFMINASRYRAVAFFYNYRWGYLDFIQLSPARKNLLAATFSSSLHSRHVAGFLRLTNHRGRQRRLRGVQRTNTGPAVRPSHSPSRICPQVGRT